MQFANENIQKYLRYLVEQSAPFFQLNAVKVTTVNRMLQECTNRKLPS